MCQILVIRKDRRIADVETVYDSNRGNPFNPFFATASLLLQAVNDNPAFPPLKRPLGRSFVVKNIFTDFKRTTWAPISTKSSSAARFGRSF